MLFGDIAALAQKGACCFANNKFFAELHDVNHATISRDISLLEKLGYIEVEIDQNEGNKRRIWTRQPNDTQVKRSCANGQEVMRERSRGHARAYKRGHDATRIYNNTSINNKSNNTTENARAKKNEDFEVFDLSENDAPELTHSASNSTGPAPNFYEAAREVIKYLNAAAGFDIYPGAGKGTKLIIDRMQDGATYQDCCAVIDLKVAQTRKRRRDGDFIFKREWLYPTTLFKPDKFEKYLQEVKDLKNGQHQHAAPTTAAEIAAATREYHKANGIDVSQLLFGHSSTDD